MSDQLQCACGCGTALSKDSKGRIPKFKIGHGNRKDITGIKFGRLTAVKFLKIGKRNAAIWEFDCECARVAQVMLHHVTRGTQKSCGCLRSEMASKMGSARQPIMLAAPSRLPRSIAASERPWRLRSDMNVTYAFKNLCKFVRENKHLFQPEETVAPIRKSIAAKGLATLSIRRKKPVGSWHGWTWNSQQERLKNEGCDLLERQAA